MDNQNKDMLEKELMEALERVFNTEGTGVNAIYEEENRLIRVWSLTKHKGVNIQGNGNGGADMIVFLHSRLRGDYDETTSYPLASKLDAKILLEDVLKEMKRRRES